jgi:predicted metal-dependent hydrolase
MRNKMLKTKIKDREIEYTVDYRKVKYIRYELRGGKLRLILPKRYDGNIEECIHKKEKWIYDKLVEYDEVNVKLEEQTRNIYLIQRTEKEFKNITNRFFEKYQNQLNVNVKRIQYRHMTTKWGSCSSLGNVTLSKDLIYLPEDLIAYIIYHELAHLIILDHSDKFFNIIKKEFPDYKSYDSRLNEYWYLIKKEG